MHKLIGSVFISLTVISCSNLNRNEKNSLNRTSVDTADFHAKLVLEGERYRKRLLKNLNEPDIETATIQTYRFWLWQAFDSCQVLFRVEKDSIDNVTLTTKYYLREHPDGTGKDTVLNVSEKRLTIKDWETIETKSKESYFWTLEETDNPVRDGTDGSSWTIEGKRFPEYPSDTIGNHFKSYSSVNRLCPYRGSFHELGVTIAKLSNQRYEKSIY